MTSIIKQIQNRKTFAISFAFMVGPWLGTTALDLYGPFNLWIGCLVFGLMSTVMMLKLKK